MSSFQLPIWLNDVINLFFPNICQACGGALVTNEKVICLSCLYKLPTTGFHHHEDNIIASVFWGRANLFSATSYLFFNKGGSVQHLMHSLKYKSQKETGVLLGKLFGKDLMESPLFNAIDLIIPVPLHPKKFHSRGFNQSQVIASGIGSTMNVPVESNNLIRIVNTASQTRKSRYNRWENVRSAFSVRNPGDIAGKHILLVDDVLTTGATLEACAETLLEIEGVKVSIATLAYAQA